MKQLIFTMVLTASACSPTPLKSQSNQVREPANLARPTIQLPEGYTLVWNDEFAGTALDTTKWKILSRVRGDATDDPSSVSITNGLKITTYTEQDKNYTAFLSTQGLFQSTYGYFEARINFHDSPGEWCAFWIQSPTNGNPIGDPANAGVEIDVTEHRAVAATGVPIEDKASMGALHWDGYGIDHKDATSAMASPRNGLSLQGNFHTYGVLWSNNGYNFYLDGNLVKAQAPPEAPTSHAKEFIYLSCEVKNGAWAGSVPAGGYGSRKVSQTGMDVAWVRVWRPPN